MIDSIELNQAEIDKNHLQVRKSIHSSSRLSRPYLIMNGLATVVAGYGLLADSTAVVIGAMIIAMLLGPIMGLALSMVDGDTGLLRHALIAETVGAIMVVLIGIILGRIHLDIDITREILSRTKPNLLDLAIAVAGGAAGAYATISPKVSVGLVGVAISTALVPPLASCGICISRGLYPEAMGAFILFFTNLVAIQCISSVVLYAFGFHKITTQGENDKKFWQRLAVDGAIFLILTVFLYSQLAKSVGEAQFQRNMQTRLERGLRAIPGAYLNETRFVQQGDKRIVVAVVHSPNSVTPAQTAQLEAQLGKNGDPPIELHVRSLLTKETTSLGYLHELRPKSLPVDALPRQIDPDPEPEPDFVTEPVVPVTPPNNDAPTPQSPPPPASSTSGDRQGN